MLAQWLPKCPEALKRGTIQQIAQTDNSWDRDEQYAAMAAVIVAMKNQGAKANAYLKERATRDLSALVALSLSDGGKYRAFIRKTAMSTPTEIPALLALMEAEGADGAAKFAIQSMGELLGLDECLRDARSLHDAFRSLDSGQPVSCLPATDRLGSLLPLLPYVLVWLWKWTDAERPNVPALAALMASDDFAAFLEATSVDEVGFATRIARLLCRADDKSAAALRKALHTLLGSDKATHLRNIEYVLLLGKLSDHRLWTEPPQREQPKLSVEDAISCAGAWDLLIDDAGEPRPVVKWSEIGHYWNIRFPLDPRSAARAIQLLASFSQDSNSSKSIRPATEIERQLLYRHFPAARP